MESREHESDTGKLHLVEGAESLSNEMSPDDEDTNFLLEKLSPLRLSSGVEDHHKQLDEGASESLGRSSAKSTFRNFSAATTKARLFDKSSDDKTFKHSILVQDSYDDDTPPASAKEDVKEMDHQQSFEVVSNKASQFGFGSSTPDDDVALLNTDNVGLETKTSKGSLAEQEEDEGILRSETNNKEKRTPSKNSSKRSSKETDIQKSPLLSTKNKSSTPVKNSNSKRSSKESSDIQKSPLLSTNNDKSRPSPAKDVTSESGTSVSFFSSTPTAVKFTSKGDKEAETSLLHSPHRSDFSSEDDSPFLNTSEEADTFLSPSVASDDGVGVCSKYSQLSEDGSTPSSPEKTVGAAAGDEPERAVFEHALELGVAFTEFVDVDNFVKVSLGNKNPHTEDGFGGRSEEHLLTLLQGRAMKHLKSYLRTSQWPAESDARHNQWLNLCGHLVKAGGGLFAELSKDVLGTADSCSIPLSVFVDAENAHSYFLNQHGVNTARGVLAVIANTNPDIIFCPLLYPMVCAFLHYMAPSACFDCMQALLGSASMLYLPQARVNNQAMGLVLRDLAKKYTKQAYVLIVRSSKNVDAVFESWIWWLFKDLPFQCLVRIIDSYLLEGFKVLFRMALAVLLLFTKDNNRRGSRTSPVTNIGAAISRFCTSFPHEPRKLIKAGFGIRGLTRREIQKLRDKHEASLRSQSIGEETIPVVASTISMGHNSVARSYNGPSDLSAVKSKILSPDMLQTLWGWIPIRMTLKKLELLFTSDVDGTTLRMLFARTQYAPQTVIAIKSTDGSVFGAYCSASWATRLEVNTPHMSFFGTGETFVFTMSPGMKKFPWTGSEGGGGGGGQTTDLFMAADDTMLIIGSGNGEAILLDNMLDRCSTTHCDTFDNEPLCPQQDFSCQCVEVFGFVD